MSDKKEYNTDALVKALMDSQQVLEDIGCYDVVLKQVKRNSEVLSAAPRPPVEIIKLRESLIELRDMVHDAFHGDGTVKGDVLNALRRANIALQSQVKSDSNIPVRNCDIGTPEEQAKRHEKWCNTALRDAHEFYDNEKECLGCHSKSGDTRYCFSCPFQWMKMPYEEDKDDN